VLITSGLGFFSKKIFFKEAASKYHQFYLQNNSTPILSTPLRFLVLYGASCFSSRVLNPLTLN
jgi:hypothetical protein